MSHSLKLSGMLPKKLVKPRITTKAPSAAPLDTPMMPGSTSGFLKRPCSTAPDTPSALPMSTVKRSLGRRMFMSTTSCAAVNSPCDSPNLESRIENTPFKLSSKAPIESEKASTSTKKIPKTRLTVPAVGFFVFPEGMPLA